MKIYVSGPITGMKNGNRKAFEDAKEFLEDIGSSIGDRAVVPHDIAPWPHGALPCPPGYAKTDHSSACYLRGDLVELLKCEAIYMLRGWERSVGARLEHNVAAHCGLTIMYQGRLV